MSALRIVPCDFPTAVAFGAALSPRGVGFDESPFDGYTPRKAVKA